MKTGVFIIVAAVVASACRGGAPEPAKPPVAGQPSPPAANAPADTCGARALQYLVGRQRSEIPPAAGSSPRRVHCSSCAVTMDYSPARLNIVFDDQTGIIREVKCG